jgi:hypothetical protein
MHRQIGDNSNLVKLSFGLESSASLWNIVFDGFDQDVILIARFEGKDLKSKDLLNRFGHILNNKYQHCIIDPTESGLSIKKSFPINDVSIIREWSVLMNSIREEIIGLIGQSRCLTMSKKGDTNPGK